MDDDYNYKLQTIKDNVWLLTPEVLDEINGLVVNAGHNLVKKLRNWHNLKKIKELYRRAQKLRYSTSGDEAILKVII